MIKVNDRVTLAEAGTPLGVVLKLEILECRCLQCTPASQGGNVRYNHNQRSTTAHVQLPSGEVHRYALDALAKDPSSSTRSIDLEA